MNKGFRIAVIVIGVCLVAALYFSLNTGYVEADSGYRPIMGTFARIVVIAPDSNTANKCIEAAFTEIEKVDKLMSNYKASSEISSVNKDAFERAVKVSKSTFEVLQRSIEFSKFTEGAFDITVGPLVGLWRLAAEANSTPADAQLQQARSKVGCEKLILDTNEMTVRFATEGMRIDLGGIAKGYAVDKAAEAMQAVGAAGAMVDIGGDIKCFGTPPRGKKYWLIGLQDPDKAGIGFDTGKSLLVLELTDAAIATSGNYRRFTLIDGKEYSHIIDAGTGYGSESLASVTIIAGNAIDADALATAVSVMGSEKGLEMIEQILAAEAILISAGPEFERFYSSGAVKYISGRRRKYLAPRFTWGSESINEKADEMYKKYQVSKATMPLKLDGDWAGSAWGNVEALELKNYMGAEPEHKPKTEAKVLYDEQFIYVIFRVEDRYVRAVARQYHDSVWEDSCVEFFFTPGPDISLGYFNVEINCGGTMLFNYQPSPRTGVIRISDSDCDKVKIYHSEPKIVEPEKQEPTTWVIEYRVPIDVLEKYCSIIRPAPGVLWRANFYKCADKTSHPHWLTWSVVDKPEPDFHQPEFFGTLEFK